MGAVISFLVDLVRRNKASAHDVIDVVESAAVGAVHDVADSVEELVESM